MSQGGYTCSFSNSCPCRGRRITGRCWRYPGDVSGHVYICDQAYHNLPEADQTKCSHVPHTMPHTLQALFTLDMGNAWVPTSFAIDTTSPTEINALAITYNKGKLKRASIHAETIWLTLLVLTSFIPMFLVQHIEHIMPLCDQMQPGPLIIIIGVGIFGQTFGRHGGGSHLPSERYPVRAHTYWNTV